MSLKIDEPNRSVHLTVREDELSKAIGRKGQNARLTSRLVGYDLIIEKDERAAEAFEAHMGGAVHIIADACGISEAVARKLTEAGFIDLAIIAGADVEDVAGILDDDHALAEQIVKKASASHPHASE